MEFSQESIKDIFIHFPGLVGIFDSISEHFIWGNENWAKQYAPSDRIVPETINTIAERYIHHDDQPTFLNFYHRISEGSCDSISFFIRFADHVPEPVWFLCTFKRFRLNQEGLDLICCHQSDLDHIDESGHIRDFYHDFKKRHPMPSLRSLTDREMEILKLIAQGLSYTEIAERLFIQPETVNKHRKNIQNKLHLNNIVLLTCFAIENGLV